MIRHALGNEFLLIAQDDHARLSGKLAAHWGNDRFGTPLPFHPTLDAIALHDSGWPLHDEHPTLNERGLPLDVLETPTSIAIEVWSESVRRTSEAHVYCGLLVSLHVMALSGIAQQHRHGRAEVFELSKFQHRQIEVQEELRRRLGLAVDRPLQLGLASPGTSADEDLLLFNYNLLKTLDRVSLDVCSGRQLFRVIDGIYARPGESAVSLTVSHPGDFAIAVDPWPFNVERFDEPLPCRRMPGTPYRSNDEFREAYASAPAESVEVRVVQP